jgi:SnoaL-like domain
MQSNHAWVLLVAGLGILHAVSPAPAVTAADDDPGLRAILHDVEASERSAVRLADTPAKAPMTLRVTYVFRKEDGRWTLLHRHADPLVETTARGFVQEP